MLNNEVIENLLKRRSYRKFKSEQITDAELKTVIEAGRWAASGMGRQGTVYVAVQNPEDRATIARLNASVMGGTGDPYYGAPTVVLIFADMSVSGVAFEDACLSIGNMLNAAESLGLGSCWIHRTKEMFETEEGKALLVKWGVTGDLLGVGSCILGYPDGEPRQPVARREGNIYYIK